MPGNVTPGAAPATASVPTGGAKQGLLSRIFENNQGKWLIGLGAATLIVMIMYARRQSSQSTATDTGSVASTTPTPPDQMFGSQLETDYQQMIANQNTTTGLLQAISNQLSNTSPTPPAPTPTPNPITNKLPTGPFFTHNPTSTWMFDMVSPGDTLESIALHAGYKDVPGMAAWQQLYQGGPGGTIGGGNAYIISSVAKAHGIKGSFENSLYPGEKIYVPGKV